MEKNIYKMKLHDQLYINDNLTITRVPGGWLYSYIDRDYTKPKCLMFVPFDNEFQERVKTNEFDKF